MKKLENVSYATGPVQIVSYQLPNVLIAGMNLLIIFSIGKTTPALAENVLTEPTMMKN